MGGLLSGLCARAVALSPGGTTQDRLRSRFARLEGGIKLGRSAELSCLRHIQFLLRAAPAVPHITFLCSAAISIAYSTVPRLGSASSSVPGRHHVSVSAQARLTAIPFMRIVSE